MSLSRHATESEMFESPYSLSLLWNQSMGDSVNWTTGEGSGLVNSTPPGPRVSALIGEIRIPLYSIIFFLAIIGNVLVIVTLAQNRRMRTVTNVFLLNLSISDLLLAVFCMPFTLIPTLLKDFVFGKALCILIRYLQGKSTYFVM